jgi:hypothetical protein
VSAENESEEKARGKMERRTLKKGLTGFTVKRISLKFNKDVPVFGAIATDTSRTATPNTNGCIQDQINDFHFCLIGPIFHNESCIPLVLFGGSLTYTLSLRPSDASLQPNLNVDVTKRVN